MVPSAGGRWDSYSLERFGLRVPKGTSGYIAEGLEQPLLLPKDMEAYKRFKQNDLFMSMKRDLTMVGKLHTHEF